MKIDGALLDLSGTLHVNDEPIPGAIQAVARLRKAGVPVLAVSNTSRRTRADLAALLARMGFDFREDEILTAPLAARRWLEMHRRRPLLLVHDDLLPEFAGIDTHSPDTVLVADAAEGFSYSRLNEAFRLLMNGAPLIATGMNRYFRDGDHLSLDAGPFVHALEYAAGTEAVLVGKPAGDFFRAALQALDCAAERGVMIGDDAENDVAGAIQAGLQGVLVKTGKYRDGDEKKARGCVCVADIAAAVDRLLDSGMT